MYEIYEIIEEIKDIVLSLLAQGKISSQEAFMINMRLEELRLIAKRMEEAEKELEKIKNTLKNFTLLALHASADRPVLVLAKS